MPKLMGQKIAVPRGLAPKKIGMSDGMTAMETRLAGAKKNKMMKPPTSKGRQKPDFSGVIRG